MDVAQPASAGVVFPEPEDKDFEDDIGEEERKHYIAKYKDLNSIKSMRLHCTACDRHLGCAAKADGRMRTHPMLRTLVCRACHTFYNSGEFERGDDGSELYCRWCGQGGQVYCCSACPHVFCAKCVKRNMGVSMIREIESLDDWKCFKCNPSGLWDLRATCWALLRYCDLKNKLAYTTEDAELKEKYQKECAIDESECCKNKKRISTPSIKKEKDKEKEKEKKEKDSEESKRAIIAKIPSGIQVKKFATVNVDSILKAAEKKAIKRPGSPLGGPMRSKNVAIRAPIPIAPYPRNLPMQQMASPRIVSTHSKKIKMPTTPIMMNHLMNEPRKMYTPRGPRPRIPAIQYPQMNMSRMPMSHSSMPHSSMPHGIMHSQFNNFNGYNNFVNSDNINLSLESLTQGLDMAAMSAMGPPDNELVCTPDFPIEPLCEVTEDTHDDDVECITPGPVAQPKPPLAPQRSLRTLPDLSPDNIIQMTDNDVTVNAVTGGLKFRVDPQTLSSNKMYRLPDGRIFAINSNPSMPGGYSATIVAVSDGAGGASPSPVPLRGATYAANLSAVVTSPAPPPLSKLTRKPRNRSGTATPQPKRDTKKSRNIDMKTPIEWYRYNLVDAVDALEYSLSRLQRLKKEADSRHLRTRTLIEMRSLHQQLERHLHTSSTRFQEIKENLNRGFKSYLKKKGKPVSEDDDDDDVEILPDDPPKHDDPIFIDENSLESVGEVSDHEVTALSSDHNESLETDPNKDKNNPLAEEEESITAPTQKSDEISSKPKSDDEEVTKDSDLTESQSEKKDTDSKDSLDSEKIGDIEKEIQEKESSAKESSEKESHVKDSHDKETPKIEENKNNEPEEHSKEEEKKEEADESKANKSKEDKDEDDDVDMDSKGEDELTDVTTDVTDNSKRDTADSDKDKAITSGHVDSKIDTDIKEELSKGSIPDGLEIPEIDESLFESDKSKVNGSGTEVMDVDVSNGEVGALDKGADDLQMSDEMIDNLLADDGAADLGADLQKFTDRSLDSLPEADLGNSEFN